MESCKTCILYSEEFDDLHRDFNDVGNETEHFCPMYEDNIPDGVFDGKKSCDFHIDKGG